MGGWVQPWYILALALALGLAQAVETPARQSFIAHLVTREELPNAITLNFNMFHLTRFAVLAIAAVLVAMTAEDSVFLINGITFSVNYGWGAVPINWVRPHCRNLWQHLDIVALILAVSLYQVEHQQDQ